MTTISDQISAIAADYQAQIAMLQDKLDTANADLASATTALVAAQSELTLGKTTADSILATLTPAQALTISGSPTTTLSVGQSMSFMPTTTGGTGPYTFSFAGTRSPLFNCDSTTGAISGTNLPAGTYEFVITVTDSSTPKQTATLPAFSITVS